MTEIRSCAADFARLRTADSAGLARFIRENQIRGHDEKESDPREFGDERDPSSAPPKWYPTEVTGEVFGSDSLDRRQRHRDLRILIRICELGRAPDNAT